jgi:hypothetical protein
MKRKASPDTTITVIDTRECISISGNSTITYKLGKSPEGELHVRLHENTGGGFFNDHWVKATDLIEAVKHAATDTGLSSAALRGLFRGNSTNTPAFFTAVLRAEGVLLPQRSKSRRHLLGDVETFLGAQVKPRAKAKSARQKQAALDLPQ